MNDRSAPATPPHEHEFEAAHGLPEALPPGERILWQGGPSWRGLARHVLHVPALAAYFAALLLLRAVDAWQAGASAAALAVALAGPAALGATALVLVLGLARLTADTTVYTLTDRRVVMRIGIVLTVTFNLPLRCLANAALAARPRDRGDIALTLAGTHDRIAWLHLWPHARPWRLRQPQPTLRCIPEAAQVASLLCRAWAEETGRALRAGPVAGAAGVTSRPMADDAAVTSLPAGAMPS